MKMSFKGRHNSCFALPKALNFNERLKMTISTLMRCQRKFKPKSAIFSVLSIKSKAWRKNRFLSQKCYSVVSKRAMPFAYWVRKSREANLRNYDNQ
jgi:hypothetical protein